NLITAQVAVFLFLGINVRLEQNDVLALVGILVIFGIVVKVEDNLLLGLLAGLIHAGILAELDCSANEWLGLLGIVWLSLAELLAAFGALVAGALGAMGFAGTGSATLNQTVATGTNLIGSVRAFGLV